MTPATDPPVLLTRDQFLAGFRASGVLSGRQLARADDSLTPFLKTAREVADHLMAAGFLTRFQAERMLIGQADGFLIGPYVVTDYLGKSAGGRVYKAHHRTMNRAVAMHILAAEVTADDAHAEAIRTQARAAARLAHPNVVTLLDVNTAGDRLYLIHEYVDGPDAGSLVRAGGPLPVHRACDLIRQAAVGLQHAHETHTHHGRLAPSSLKVGRPGGVGPEDRPVVKVAGLGLGSLTGERCDTGFEYLAPEQFDDPHRADAATDLYSLGCVFHLLLTGLPPFPSATPHEAAAHHRHTPLQPIPYLRPDTPAPVVALLNALLAKPPHHRPGSAAEVAAALEPFSGLDEAAMIDFSLPPSASPAVSRQSELSGLLATLPLETADEAGVWAGIANSESMEGGPDTLEGTRRSDTLVIARPRTLPRGPARRLRWVARGLTLAGGFTAVSGLAVVIRLMLKY